MTDDDCRAELATLVAAFGAYLDQARASGAVGLPAAAPGAIEQVPPGPRQSHEPSERPAEAPPRVALGSTPAAGSPQDAATLSKASSSHTELELLRTRVSECTLCPLHEARKQTVFARGTGSSGLCFVGEGPGADEDAQGYPFVGKAGQLLDRMIRAMGFERDEVYVCNIVKCRPPKNRKPEPDEMATCRPYLEEQLQLVAPRVIVALGATAVEGLLGVSGGITRLRGNWRLYDGRIAVMPTFHPAYLLRNPAAKRDVWNDLKEVLNHMGRAIPQQ